MFGILKFRYWKSFLCYACLSFIYHVVISLVAIIEYTTEIHRDIAQKLNFETLVVFIC